MEIRNNVNMNSSPAFGMAVVKPSKAEDLARFVTDTTKDVYFNSKHVHKALERTMAKAAKNTQFDIVPFEKEVFKHGNKVKVLHYRLVPKTPEAKQMMLEQKWTQEICNYYLSPLDECSNASATRLQGTKGLRRFFAKTANFCSVAKEIMSCYRHPEKLMDGRLRFAVDYAADCEAKVLERIKSEKIVNDLFDGIKVAKADAKLK